MALALACLLTVILTAPVMADGPGKNGQGADPAFGTHPPNDVWVPLKAYEARGQNPPGRSENNNGAIFHPIYVPGQG